MIKQRVLERNKSLPQAFERSHLFGPFGERSLERT
jgi:hypothetical protein